MSLLRHSPPQPRLWSFSTLALRCAIVSAALSGAVLLFSDVFPLLAAHLTHAPTSAIPLLLIGTAYALAQLRLRPRRGDLAQALLVSAAFTSWGIYQLLPAGPGTTFLGDLVITMYVADVCIALWKQTRRSAS